MVSAGYGDAASSVPGPHPPSSVGGFTPHSYGGGPTLPSSTFNVTAFQNSVRHRKITPASAPQSRGEYYVRTVVPGFRVLGFSALPEFRALKAGDGLVGT